MKHEIYFMHITKLKITVASAHKDCSAQWKSLGMVQSWYDGYTKS